jgi:uncharacterized phage protein (TIGR01671 family)
MKNAKFRSWDEKDKSFHYVSLECNDCYGARVLGTIETAGGKPWQQFIDRTDKNGKEIYKGDIVYSNHYRRVDWIGAGFWFVDVIGNGKDIEPTLDEVKNWEVVSNIYENPELLK